MTPVPCRRAPTFGRKGSSPRRDFASDLDSGPLAPETVEHALPAAKGLRDTLHVWTEAPVMARETLGLDEQQERGSRVLLLDRRACCRASRVPGVHRGGTSRQTAGSRARLAR